MNADFFRQDKRRRLSNPNYAPSHIISAMVFPVINQPTRNQQKINYIPTKIQTQPHQRNPQNQKYQVIRKSNNKSNLSSYGSSSLKRLHKISNHQIIQGQKKKYDIINNYTRGKQPVKLYQIAKQKQMVSGKITQMPVNQIDESKYNGISTMDYNLKLQEKQKIRNRPKYLNNVHEIQF